MTSQLLHSEFPSTVYEENLLFFFIRVTFPVNPCYGIIFYLFSIVIDKKNAFFSPPARTLTA